MIGGKGGSDLTQKANHPNIFRLNPDRPCEIAGSRGRALAIKIPFWYLLLVWAAGV